MTDDILSPNTRLSSIKKYLAKPPRDARLRLVASAENGGTPVQLGEWPNEECTPQLALEIVALMEDHANELRSRITGTLVFVGESGNQVGGTKVISHRPIATGDSGDSLASLPQQLTGDSASQASQAQKHLEVMMRMMLTSIAGQFQMMRAVNEHTMELCETLATRLAESETRERVTARRADELEEAIGELSTAADTTSVSAAQEKIIKILEPAIPMLIQKFMSGGAK